MLRWCYIRRCHRGPHIIIINIIPHTHKHNAGETLTDNQLVSSPPTRRNEPRTVKPENGGVLMEGNDRVGGTGSCRQGIPAGCSLGLAATVTPHSHPWIREQGAGAKQSCLINCVAEPAAHPVLLFQVLPPRTQHTRVVCGTADSQAATPHRNG